MLQSRGLSFHLRMFYITTTLCSWSCYLIYPCLCLAIQWVLMIVATSGLEGLNELMQMKYVEWCLTHTKYRIKWSIIWERKKCIRIYVVWWVTLKLFEVILELGF